MKRLTPCPPQRRTARETACRSYPRRALLAMLLLAFPAHSEEWNVFLLAGQSNMEGVGLTNQAPASLLSQPDVQLYHSSSIRSAMPPNQWNPLSPAGAGGDKFGPELAFAFRMKEYLPGKKIALIKHARGGTKLTVAPLSYETTSWHPGESNADIPAFGEEYSKFVNCVTNALSALRARGDTPVICGMLWVQGEADSTSETAGNAYAQNLSRFVRRVREQFNSPDLPFVCARILPYQTRPGSAAVRLALTNADQESGHPSAIPAVFTVFTEGLGVHDDAVHFNTPGQIGLGALLAKTLYHRALQTPFPAPPSTLACWQIDEKSDPAYLLDAAGIHHLDLHVTNTTAPAVMPVVNQPDRPLFIDGTDPRENRTSGDGSAGLRRIYDTELDMRDQPWTFEALFRNHSIGTQSTYEVIGGTRCALSQYHGWRVIMLNGKIRFFATANSGQTAHIITEQRYDDGNSHHLAAIWQPDGDGNGIMQLYIDGVLAGECAGVGDLGDASIFPKRFAIGANVSGTPEQPLLESYRWNGVLDEIRFTAGALPPTDFLLSIPKGTVLRISAHNSLERIYPDKPPVVSEQISVHVPRGGRAWIQVAIQTAMAKGSLRLKADKPLSIDSTALNSKIRIQALRKVVVDANYGGCARTRAGLRPSAAILESVVRTAPFETYECLSNTDLIRLDGRKVYAALLRADVSPDASPGTYRGFIRAEIDEITGASVPFTIVVHRTQLPQGRPADVVRWLWPAPENLTGSPLAPWWSENHWQLLKSSGTALHDYGDTIVFTPLISSKHPLIAVSAHPSDERQWTFDFSRFRRWVETFKEIGFTGFMGCHLNKHTDVFLTASSGDSAKPLGLSFEDYHRIFLPAFYHALYATLGELGIRDRYYQNLSDEPREKDLEHYRAMAETLRECMPDVAIAEALHRNFTDFSPHVDIPAWWFGKVYSAQWHDLAAERRRTGKQHWIYYACTPPPPWPNSHLDTPLWRVRALAWVIDYCRADGILHWAANAYRGADPYASSIGPLPDGSTSPGHPPGDNWLFYPTPSGLTASMRMVAFCQGLEDLALLEKLRRLTPREAQSIAEKIIVRLVLDTADDTRLSEYADNAAAYSTARFSLLNALDKL